jgi:hypothetical protein
MDIDFAPDTLLQLLEEKIFDVLVVSQVGHESKDNATADQQNDNQSNNNTSSNHSSSLDRSSLMGNCIISVGDASYRITCMKSTKSVS